MQELKKISIKELSNKLVESCKRKTFVEILLNFTFFFQWQKSNVRDDVLVED